MKNTVQGFQKLHHYKLTFWFILFITFGDILVCFQLLEVRKLTICFAVETDCHPLGLQITPSTPAPALLGS